MNPPINLYLNFKVPYYELWELCWFEDSEIKFKDPSIVNTLLKNNLTVVDCSRDPWDVSGTKQFFDSHGLENKVIFLTGCYDSSDSDSIVFFPTFLYNKSLENQNILQPAIGKRQYKLSCLNRSPKQHRLYFYYYFKQKPYFNETLSSFYHHLINPYDGQTITLDHPVYRQLSTKFKQEIEGMSFYKEAIPGDNKWNNDHSYSHPAFSDTYLNLTTESAMELRFYSEKTFKPFVSGQLFLTINGQNSVDGLRSMGFECFDHVFNNHDYESHRRFTIRIDNLLISLDDWYSNIENIYFDNIAGLQHNQEYVLSDSFRNRLLAPLKQLDLITGGEYRNRTYPPVTQ